MGKRVWWHVVLGVIVGGIIALGGFGIGKLSHHVTYLETDQTAVRDYIVGDEKVYIQLSGVDAYFTVVKKDVTPAFDSNLLDSAQAIIVFDPDKTDGIDVTAISGSHFKGTSYTAVALSLSGRAQSTFTTADYRAHPTGYDENFWTFAYVFIGLGLLILLVSLIAPGRAMILLGWAGLGLVGGPFLGLVFVGISIPTRANGASLQAALTDNILLLVVTAVLGLVIGFLIGIVQAIRNEEL